MPIESYGLFVYKKGTSCSLNTQQYPIKAVSKHTVISISVLVSEWLYMNTLNKYIAMNLS